MNCIAGLSALLLVLAAAGPSLALGSKTAADLAAKAEEGGEILVSYTAPLRRIVLTRDLHLADTEEIAEYDNPVAAEPSKTKTVKKTALVSEHEAAELLRFIRESGFFNLKAAYGGKPEERNYPTIILVWDKEKKKQVAYYSRPDAESRPTAFAKTEQKIIEFAQHKAVELKSGGK
ncbi:hypothetical protein [Candidatus Electronema sp. PJ]|uniref:hypothetical protein n=1 Tax=Candidatus Electronema sp. PJ TaxID=3401572 RepID=UPI003AA7C7C0